MRFISGNRDNKAGSKKGLAGALYKLSLTGKKPPEPTPEEKYQKMFDAKMSKMMDDLAKGKKSGFVLPGTKSDNKPKEMSKSFKATMEMLARKKAQLELKKQQKKAKTLESKKYFAKKAQELKKTQELQKQQMTIKQQQMDLELQQQQDLERQQQQQQQQSSSGSYFFGTVDEKKDSWW